MNLKILKNTNFTLFVIGQTTSVLGTVFLNIALGLYILKLTGSAGKFSSVLALAMLPGIILGPVAGTIIERLDRKKLIVVADIIRGVFAITLFIVSLFMPINIGLIYFTTTFYSICQAFFSPAFIRILPGILSKEELVDGNSIQNTFHESAAVIAPFLGALIFTSFGISIIFLIDGLTYLVAAFAAVYMKVPPLEKHSKKFSFFRDIADGFKILFVDVRITSLISNGILSHIFLFPFATVGFPYMIVTLLGGNELDYGFVQSVASVGSIVPIFFVSMAKKRFNIAECIGIGIIGMLVFVLAMLPLANGMLINVLTGNSILIKVFFSAMIFLFYLSFGFYAVFYVSFYQSTLPENFLGRYISLQALFFSLGRLFGYKLFGYLFDQHELIVPIFILGIGMLLKVLVHIPFMRETKRTSESAPGIKA